jgi:tRNA nucleotidyltransferase/poly(A) polymerase
MELVRNIDLVRGFDFYIMTNAALPRIKAILEEYKVVEDNSDDGELVVGVLGIIVSVVTYTDLKSELAKRNAFTFDAIAYNTESGFSDFFGGTEALEKNEIIFVDTDEARFNPHDILPALAWYSTREYTIPEQTNRLITEHYTKAMCLRKDFEIILIGKNAAEVLSEYSDVFTATIPELKMLNTLNPELLERTFKAVGNSSPVMALRYALLFRELGKPDCHSRDWQDDDFFHGQVERARIYAVRIMTRLGCSEDEIRETEWIIENEQELLHSDKFKKYKR